MNTVQRGGGFWRRALVRVFACDPRSLAVFRIALGLMILLDVALRWPYAEAFLTDAGPIDRATAMELLDLDYGHHAATAWSLNFLSGDLWFQQTLLVCLAIAAGLLMLGWRTWWMTLACWILVVSLHMRCPVILSSGDTFLRCILFWSLFAPLGSWWSLDAERTERAARRADPHYEPEVRVARPVLTAGTAGLIGQLILMYLFPGFAKWNIHWWEGDAMEYVFRLDLYARPWTAELLAYPLLLKLISWGTLFAEVFLILLLLVPWRNTWWRTVNIVTYFGLHLSIAATMEIGLFPYISMVGWLPLLPAAFWRWTDGRDADYYRRLEQEPYQPTLTAHMEQVEARDWRGGLRWLGNTFAAGMLVYAVLWNVANIPHAYDGDLAQRLEMDDATFARYISARKPFALAMPEGLRWLGPLTGTGQHFQMFGVPPLHTPWFVYDATLEDGMRIDLQRLEPVSYQRPPSILRSIPGHHWRKLHDNLLGYGLRSVQRRVAEYHMQKWNDSHREGKQVVALKVTCFAEKTGPQYQGQAPETLIWYQWQRPIDSLEDLLRQLEQNPDLLLGL